MSKNLYFLNGKTIEEYLLDLAKDGSKEFTQSLHPGIDNILGLRIPHLRKLACEIARGDWQTYLATAGTYYMEERMLQGLVLGQLKGLDVEDYLILVDKFVPLINSWSVCDTFSFSGGQRWVDRHQDRIWSYLEKWARSDREYEIRFAVVMMMSYFINAAYIDRVLTWMQSIVNSNYYVEMAIAWSLSVCFVKFPDKTMPLFTSGNLSQSVRRKAIQKICDSYRVNPLQKQIVRQYR